MHPTSFTELATRKIADLIVFCKNTIIFLVLVLSFVFAFFVFRYYFLRVIDVLGVGLASRFFLRMANVTSRLMMARAGICFPNTGWEFYCRKRL